MVKSAQKQAASSAGVPGMIRATDGRLIGGNYSANLDPFADGEDAEAAFEGMSVAQKLAMQYDRESEMVIDELAAR